MVMIKMTKRKKASEPWMLLFPIFYLGTKYKLVPGTGLWLPGVTPSHPER